jgi:hypothetical protein
VWEIIRQLMDNNFPHSCLSYGGGVRKLQELFMDKSEILGILMAVVLSTEASSLTDGEKYFSSLPLTMSSLLLLLISHQSRY